MSEFVNNALGYNVQSLDASPQFDGYSGVEIIVDDDTSYFAGDETGRVLRFENPWGTQAQANNILASIRGFQYQPYKATKAILSPAAELGDAVTINMLYGGVYKLTKTFGPGMLSDIEAPQDEEVDHEYPYEPKTDRVYKREISEAKAAISVTASEISAEVLRATQAEGTLASRITQNANDITAKVSKSSPAGQTSFSWSLTDTSWVVKSNGTPIFTVNSSGASVKGVITATSGAIGGFTIGSSSLYSGMTSLNSTANGVYVGTDGISVGGGRFKVTKAGAVSATNMTLSGTLNIGGTNISADALRSGAQTAYNNSGTWNSTSSTVDSNSGYWSGGAGWGYGYGNATSRTSGSYPNYFKASNLACTNLIVSSGITFGDSNIRLVQKSSATMVLGY